MEGKPSPVEATQEAPLEVSFMHAVELVPDKSVALDLGPGDFDEVRYLLAQNFSHIVAVDRDEKMKKKVTQLNDTRVEPVEASFEDYDFPEGVFSLVNAQRSLPFVRAESFADVIKRMKASLKLGGIFVGSFWGPRSSWNGEPNSSMPPTAFVTLEEARALFSDMEIIESREAEMDGRGTVGTERHWHYIYITARKI